MSDVISRKSENKNRKSGFRNHISGIRNQKSDIRNQRSVIRSQKSDVRFISLKSENKNRYQISEIKFKIQNKVYCYLKVYKSRRKSHKEHFIF